jgi:hypothetical protein
MEILCIFCYSNGDGITDIRLFWRRTSVIIRSSYVDERQCDGAPTVISNAGTPGRNFASAAFQPATAKWRHRRENRLLRNYKVRDTLDGGEAQRYFANHRSSASPVPDDYRGFVGSSGTIM